MSRGFRRSVAVALLVIAIPFGGARAQAAPSLVLRAGQYAEIAGTHVECGAMSSEHGSTLVGVMCYEKPQPSLGPFAPRSYQVVIRLDGLTQMVRVDSHGFPDGPVFSRPAGTPLGAYALGSNTSKTSRSFTIPLGARFQLGRTRLGCRVAITGIAASDERSALCAFFGNAGMPQPNSWGFALSNLAAYVVHFDAAGHAAGGFSRPEPRR